MKPTPILCVVLLVLGAALVWSTMLSPAARDCRSRGDEYYPAEDFCGVLEFSKR
jgi:hypothetical protein